MNYKEEKRGPTMILVQSPWGKAHILIVFLYIIPIGTAILNLSHLVILLESVVT